MTLASLADDGSGGQCITTREVPVSLLARQGSTPRPAIELVETGPEAIRALEEQGYSRCTAADAAPSEPLDPGVVAWALWEDEVDLPDPAPASTPPFAVTGMPVFLDIGGELPTDTFTFGPSDALGYTIELRVSSTYDIDWGDGDVTTTTSSGGPWPDGDVRHTYQLTGDDNVVTVTQRWTAAWTATDASGATDSGVFTDSLVTSGELALPIDEIQAVVSYPDAGR